MKSPLGIEISLPSIIKKKNYYSIYWPTNKHLLLIESITYIYDMLSVLCNDDALAVHQEGSWERYQEKGFFD